MIQGGDPDSKRAVAGQMLGEGGPTYTIPAEFNKLYIHKKGVIAAARDNNPTKASSGSQFYIVQGKKYTDGQLDGMEKRNGMQYTPEQRELYKTIGGTPFLDQNYTVFGEVVEGIEMVDAIAGVPTAVGDRPTSDVRMTVKLLKKWKAPKVKPNKK